MNRDECIFLMNNIYKGSIDLMILLYERALKRALVEKNEKQAELYRRDLLVMRSIIDSSVFNN